MNDAIAGEVNRRNILTTKPIILVANVTRRR
jgi:hypothetical protein